MEGTILRIFDYGGIVQAPNGERVFFSAAALKGGLQLGEDLVNTRVLFEADDGHASQVSPLNGNIETPATSFLRDALQGPGTQQTALPGRSVTTPANIGRTPPPSVESAIDRWNRAVGELTAQGATKAEAISRLVKSQPELHAEYLAEFNRRAVSATGSPPAAASIPGAGTAVATWHNAVEAKIAEGLPPVSAVQFVARQQPELRAAYVAQVNADESARRSDAQLRKALVKRHAGAGESGGQRSHRGGNAAAQWEQLLEEKLAAGMPRPAAVRSIVAERPELHQAYIREINAGRKVQRAA